MKKRIIIGTALTIMLGAMMTSTRSCGGGYNNEKENEVVEELSQEDTNLEELEQE